MPILEQVIILTQSWVMTARIEMKSSESEAPLVGDMVKAKSFQSTLKGYAQK